MDRTPVASTMLASASYEPGTSTLEVEFLRGGIYQYYGVPASVFEQLMGASSKGSFFDQYIKKAGYAYSRVG